MSKNNLNPLNLESKIRDVGDLSTLKLYESFLNYFDDQFKKKRKKNKYNIKKTRKRTLITSVGIITINSIYYINKETNEYYVRLRDILHLKPYQRLTNEAEYQLVKYSMNENMSQAARHTLRSSVISRSTVSKKIKALDDKIEEVITRTINQPDVLYIEMDEIHANLQKGGNKICLCAKFVLDPFHYIKKHLKYIFKNDIELRNIADDYIKNDLIDDFKILVSYQIEKYPEQEKYMKQHINYIINNLDKTENQKG